MLGLWLALTMSASPVPGELELTAERLLHDGKKELTTAEGRAKLVTDGASIDADRIVYDRQRRVATASGHVVARISQGGRMAVIADVMTLRFDDEQQVREVFLYDGKTISKKDVGLEAFLEADTAEKVEKVGTTQALLVGNHLVRDGSKWTVDELELVPCECDFKNPSWSITSSSATVDTEADRVSVTSAVIRIKHFPVLWLPWLSLPLTDRQSGLLITRPGFNLNNGFMLDQPIFLTLGRSADVTLTPGFFTGATPGPEGKRIARGVAGPRLSTEFRYVPSTRATGRVLFGLLYDFREARDAVTDVELTGTVRGFRGELGWLHTQDFDKGFGARVDLNAHSDGNYNRDLTVDVIASTATYLRSTATLFHRGEDHYLGLDVGLRQDIQWGFDLLGRNPGQPEAFGPGTLQRLPAFTFGWSPSKMFGPLRFDVEADAVRLAPLFSKTGDEGVAAAEGAVLSEPFDQGVDRLFSALPTSRFGTVRSGIGDRKWQPGEREARDRLMVLPRLSISAQPWGALSVSGFAAWRQFAWAGEETGRTWGRGYLLLGGRLETEVSRSFGAFRHVIQPLVELRAIPVGVESSSTAAMSSPVPYDAVDAAVPNITPRFQGVVELRQRLVAGGGIEVLRLDLGQGFELSGASLNPLLPTIGESYGRVSSRIGWFSAQGILRLDPLASRFSTGTPDKATLPLNAIRPTRIAGGLGIDDGRHGAYISYEQLLMEGTARSRQPIDLLFLIDRGFTSATEVRQLAFGAKWDFGVVSLRYDALVGEKELTPGSTPVLALAQQTVAVGFSPACDCWRVDATLSQIVNTNPDGTPRLTVPNFGLSVTISKFGTIGAR